MRIEGLAQREQLVIDTYMKDLIREQLLDLVDRRMGEIFSELQWRRMSEKR